MADRYDWDRDQEMDRERGGENRDRENRWSQGGRHQEQGGRNPDWNRDRENWRGGSPGEFNQQGFSEYRNRESAGRYSETPEPGDWGRQGSWGSFGNRPEYNRGPEYNRESNWRQGREHDYRNESERGGYYGGRSYQGGSSFQDRDRESGGQSDRYPFYSGSFSQGQGSGSYQGGMGSFGGGMGSYGERGRFSGRGPKGWQRSDERIKEDVSERLADHPHIDASDIEVSVKAGEVTLTGTVADRSTKRQAEEVVEQVSGVKEIHNQLRAQQQPAMQGQGSGSSSSQTTGSSGTSTGKK